ncbi:MAG TPA: carboxyl transferase domain-containing protein [Candidatus Obscuribacterales bacterium]
MQTIKSQIQTRMPAFDANRQKMQALVGQLNEYLAQSRFQGEDKYLQRHKQGGKLLARERVELMLDQDSPFLELMPLAGLGQPGISPGASMITGIGLVSGVETLINASVPTIKGGAMNEYTVLKGQRLDTIAMENRLPMIYLIESAGADLNNQGKIFNTGGAAFREIARRSKAGIPSLSVVFGSCTAGGAYIPGMSDYVVMVEKQAQAYLAGPPLVRMATGEVADDESLGGAEMHSRMSGLSDYLARDERDAIRQAREIMARLNQSNAVPAPQAVDPPLYDSEELLGIVSADVRVPYDAREVIARLVDGSRFTEFKPLYGSTLVTGYAHIHGQPVGILANNGVLFSESANKGAHFIQLCNKQAIPLLFLQNITGFMVGTKYEQEGIIKNGAKLINAISSSEVPAITILMGASYGAGNYGMAGRSYQPRFLFAWPNARLAVMGPDQLVGVMEMVQRQAAAKSGVAIDEERAAAVKAKIKAQVETESGAWYCSSQVWDDGVIDPRDTRHVLGICLSVVAKAGISGSEAFGVFRM